MKKTNLYTPITIVIGMILIIWSIFLGGELSNFFDFPSIIIVVFGSICSAAITFPLATILKIPSYFMVAFKEVKLSNIQLLNLFTLLSRKARREGLLSLEESIIDVEDNFLKKGIQMVIDGVEPAIIKEILELEIDQMEERHSEGINLMKTLGDYAPAFGMVGTLIGLINMLAYLDDPTTIASSMAVALITTFYGTILSNMLYLPTSANLKLKSQKEVLQKEMMIEGILSVQSGVNTRVVEETLIAYLSSKERLEMFKATKGDEVLGNV
ncbi:motility protein A [Clostridium cellulovorans]|uniref:MotA/TolQ/ExbB proton channel n=1 Tax=Clostridium cellulovorans (strain ATCC 35296 / DSM 3052 / OCM 3 / 743B) TaxID=573061 RepID=D9SKH2_CLOC7|nr:MotA/TolQ/ExbB proton channel family protein [Clostridium cellulovorans]ADL51468.1 MotA/TolQ/ExbB proton channel [Clostridium cellulovorans 743B]